MGTNDAWRDRSIEQSLIACETVLDPLDHTSFLARLASARLVVTDSGGMQEEAAILDTPCVTVRDHTERIETLDAGVGLLAAINTQATVDAAAEILGAWPRFARAVPELYGDGRAGEKIATACIEWMTTATPVELVA